MATSPPVRAVVRAVSLLQALNRQPVSTLDMLYVQTGIPKPSIVRLLQTLQSQGLVRHAPQHGSYFLTSGVRTLSSGYHSAPMIVEAAAPVLDELTQRLKWPMAIAVPDQAAMVIRYTTVPQSPLALLHSTINMRLGLTTRALGRAYLAFCSPEHRAALLSLLAESGEAEQPLPANLGTLEDELLLIRQQGFALRKPGVRPVSNTLAVPVYQGEQLVAAVGITFFSSVIAADQAAPRFLADMQTVAQRIGTRLTELSQPATGVAAGAATAR